MTEIANRKQQPPIIHTEDAILKHPTKTFLDNQIPVYSINAGTQDVIMLRIVFDAGVWNEDVKTQAISTNSLINRGSLDIKGEDIVEKLDFYGSIIEKSTERDNASITIYTLNKYFKQIIPIFESIVKRPEYPQSEIDIFVQNKVQQIVTSEEKVDFLARRRFYNCLFGATHPYGKSNKTTDYQAIKQKDLLLYHKEQYHSNNCKIFIAGKTNDSHTELINSFFGGSDWAQNKKKRPIYRVTPNTEKYSFVKKENTLQSALKIGMELFNRNHEDYIRLQVLSTVLGGYFGSRLMTNIREDKGYTYGIGSATVSLRETGLFFISSEVGSKYLEPTMKEIFYEIKRLQTESISEKELNLVKTYLSGAFLRSIDGPFALSEKHISLIANNFDENYYENAFKTIKETTSKQLLTIANKYFNKEDFFISISGATNYES